MRIGQILRDGRELAVVEDAGGWHPLTSEDDVASVLGSSGRWATEGRAVGTGERLVAPIRPRKIVAVGLNYLDHIRETGLARPEQPLLFAKFPSVVIGPEQPIEIDSAITKDVDWEVELAVVIGQTLRYASPADALNGVFGYTVANDVSARDVQFSDAEWTRGKNLATFCPLGPVIVTPDEIGDPQNLRLSTHVNGETMQDSTTAEMVFGVGDILSYCSRHFTLEPGDVVLTGTPYGCGFFMDPQRRLEPGDLVSVEIDGIGRLENPVRAVLHPASESRT
jgi:5-carboxymethyl-2-hydroxymuconate isomerase